MVTGTPTPGNLATWDADLNLVDSGLAPGGWLVWTDTPVTCSGGMTVSAVTSAFAFFLQTGPRVDFHFAIELTIGGTPDLTLFIPTPVTPAGGNSIPFTAFQGLAAGPFSNCIGLVEATNFAITLSGGSNWAAGATYITGSGSYRG